MCYFPTTKAHMSIHAIFKIEFHQIFSTGAFSRLTFNYFASSTPKRYHRKGQNGW